MNLNRRNFLKIVLIGGGALLAGKVIGPTISKWAFGGEEESSENNFSAFRTVEAKGGLTIYDKKTGEEIFEIDQGE